MATIETALEMTPGPEELSEEDVHIIRLVAREWTDERIAKSLNVSLSTVQRRLHSAMKRLGVTSRIGLAVTAARLGLIDLEDEDGT